MRRRQLRGKSPLYGHVPLPLLALPQNDAVVVMPGADQGRESYAKSLIAHAEQLGVADRLRLVGHVEDMPAAGVAY